MFPALFVPVGECVKPFEEMEENSRFGEISLAEIQKHLENSTSKSTKTSTKFGMRIFNGKYQYNKRL